MIKFTHKRLYKVSGHGRKIVITYSMYDIIIGTLLVVLVGFYIYNYVHDNLYNFREYRVYPSGYTGAQGAPPVPAPAKAGNKK